MSISYKNSVWKYSLQGVLAPVNSFNESACGSYPGFNPGVV